MTKPNRNEPTGIIAIAFITFLLIFGLIGFYEGIRFGHSQRAEVEAQKHHENAAEYISRTCIDTERPAFDVCVKEAIKTSGEYARAEKDLSAQQNMADWARYMLIATIFSVAVTGFGVWLLKKTLDQGNEISDAALEANRIMREEQRPWVDFTVGQGTVADVSGKISFGPEIKAENFGKSLAIRVAGTITAGQTASALPGVKDLHEILKSSFGKGIGNLNLTPSKRDVVTDLWKDPFKRIVADKGKRWAVSIGQHVVICVVYQDSFGNKFGTAKRFNLIQDQESGNYLLGEKELEFHY